MRFAALLALTSLIAGCASTPGSTTVTGAIVPTPEHWSPPRSAEILRARRALCRPAATPETAVLCALSVELFQLRERNRCAKAAASGGRSAQGCWPGHF